MAFKMKGSPMKLGTIQGSAGHSSALKMKMEKDAVAKMKKESAMKMKMEAAAKMKKKSPMEKELIGNQDRLPEELKAKIEAAPGKMKKASPNKVLLEGPIDAKKKKKSNIVSINTDKDDKVVKKSKSVTSKKDPYAEALKRDPKLGSYVKERKKHKPGSAEYEAVQAKINKAYGKTRSSKLKAAQIAAQKKKDAVKPTKTEKVVAKGNKKVAEVKENVSKKTTKIAKRKARKEFGKDSKEFLKAKKANLEAKEADRQGEKGGKKQGFFRKLSSKINKRRQAKVDKKLAEK
tara:strand:- start:792 stop:1661 length:870 start_codon:yes stop_codon:yes gene_type:complete